MARNKEVMMVGPVEHGRRLSLDKGAFMLGRRVNLRSMPTCFLSFQMVASCMVSVSWLFHITPEQLVVGWSTLDGATKGFSCSIKILYIKNMGRRGIKIKPSPPVMSTSSSDQ